jgi:hypothetical protein
MLRPLFSTNFIGNVILPVLVGSWFLISGQYRAAKVKLAAIR